MNDDTNDLENDLRRLTLRPPSQRLEANLAAALDRSEPLRAVGHWWQQLGFNRPLAALGWGLCSPALTAAVILLLVTRAPSPRPATVSPGTAGRGADTSRLSARNVAKTAATPQSTNVLYETRDEGIVLDGRREPVHRLRYRSADLLQWRNPDTGAQWAVSYPREDVLLVPVQAE